MLLSHALSMRLPLGAPISHAEALQHCKELAGKLLQRSEEQQALPPGAPPTTPLTCETQQQRRQQLMGPLLLFCTQTALFAAQQHPPYTCRLANPT